MSTWLVLGRNGGAVGVYNPQRTSFSSILPNNANQFLDNSFLETKCQDQGRRPETHPPVTQVLWLWVWVSEASGRSRRQLNIRACLACTRLGSSPRGRGGKHGAALPTGHSQSHSAISSLWGPAERDLQTESLGYHKEDKNLPSGLSEVLGHLSTVPVRLLDDTESPYLLGRYRLLFWTG